MIRPVWLASVEGDRQEGAISFYASARSLEVGPAVEVIALPSVAANHAAIIGASSSSTQPITAQVMNCSPAALALSVLSWATRSRRLGPMIAAAEGW
jgi:hypothetical protein